MVEKIFEINLTQGLKTIVDEEDYEWLNKLKWSAKEDKNKTFYARRSDYSGNKKRNVYIHQLVYEKHNDKIPEGMMIDHINRNKLDNRKENLRICSAKENIRNRGAQKNSNSKYKGVCWKSKPQRYYIEIVVDGKRHYLGSTTDEILGAKAYDTAARKYHGEFAYLNFPDKHEEVYLEVKRCKKRK